MNQALNDTRFEFGKNWESYSQLVDAPRIASAVTRLSQLLGTDSLAGKTFLDIGCGSGLHALAALNLGAERVRAIDLDPDSVATTRAMLERFGCLDRAEVVQQSVFDLNPERDGRYDVVYSWGVLHHTGDMNRAIAAAARMVQLGGYFAVALYGKTFYCGAWTHIKRWYVKATPKRRTAAERLYMRLFGIYLLLRGKRLSTHIHNYHNKRGMDFMHDVRDWIGGYPYESIRPRELDALLRPLGFSRIHATVKRRSGLFGSGCDEYLYQCASHL
jgi:2-polyprenyl-6-hydroxyphenyl methylase/3-demethylubiquinone-9 3-methyltransferase